MKKLQLMLMFVFAASLISCEKADQPMTSNELPKAAQDFIKQHFPNETIASVLKDYEGVSYTYDVKFVSRKDLEFDKNGEWLQVDCLNEAVPIAIIPTNIASYVSTQYPQYFIVEIERETYSYNVELNSGLDLVFDKNGNFKHIDN